MSIGSEIGQKAFSSSVEKAKVNILYTSNWLRDLHLPLVKKKGMQLQHYNILRIVRGQFPGCISPGEIKDVVLDKGVDITRLVDKLVTSGFVHRETCPENRRKVNISLTEKGATVLKELDKALEEVNEKLAQRLTPEEAENLSNLLDKLRGDEE